MAFHLAVAPEQLLSRAMWRVGDDHPISDDPHMRLSPAFAEPESHVRINGVAYVVVSTEPDRVWIRPDDS
jgi:hypothetical protein